MGDQHAFLSSSKERKVTLVQHFHLFPPTLSLVLILLQYGKGEYRRAVNIDVLRMLVMCSKFSTYVS